MNDKVFKKQLEQFGIESTRVVESDPNKLQKQQFIENNTSVVRALMNSVEGRQWVYSQLSLCGVFATPYIPERPLDTAFQCGMQEVGHHLQREVESVAPEEYYKMVMEEFARAMNKKSDQAS